MFKVFYWYIIFIILIIVQADKSNKIPLFTAVVFATRIPQRTVEEQFL